MSILVLIIQALPQPCDLNSFALEDKALFYDIFGLPLSPQVPLFPTSGYFLASSQEIPLVATPTLEVTQNLFHPLQACHETSALQSRTAMAVSDNIVRELALFLEVIALRVYGCTAPRNSL